jgi:hypothetical protein
MVLHAKRPALAMLAGALWLTTSHSAWAVTPGANHNTFNSLLTNRNNRAIERQLENQLKLIQRVSHQLQQQQHALTGNVTSQSAPSFFVVLQQLDTRFEQQAARIAQRLESLNNLVGNPSVNQGALNRLRNELTRLDVTIGRQINTIQRLERGAATPFAPGGF